MQTLSLTPSASMLTALGGRAETLAEQARSLRGVAASLQPSFEDRCDATLAVAQALEGTGQVVADLVALQIHADDLDVSRGAIAAGQAFTGLSRALLGLRDGRAAGAACTSLVAAVVSSLADADRLLQY
jgi:hypothetical protein